MTLVYRRMGKNGKKIYQKILNVPEEMTPYTATGKLEQKTEEMIKEIEAIGGDVLYVTSSYSQAESPKKIVIKVVYT